MFVENRKVCFIAAPGPEGAMVFLQPGISLVASEQWNAIKDNWLIKHSLKKGYISTLDTKGRSDLNAVDEETAIDVVKKIWHRSTLKAIRREDQRGEVLDVVDQHLNVLADPTKDDSQKDDGDEL